MNLFQIKFLQLFIAAFYWFIFNILPHIHVLGAPQFHTKLSQSFLLPEANMIKSGIVFYAWYLLDLINIPPGLVLVCLSSAEELFVQP